MKEEMIQKALLVCGVTLTILFCLGPFFYMVLTAFGRHPDFLLPGKAYTPTLDNFRVVIFSESIPFMTYLKNSILISAISAVVSVGLVSPAAYAIARLPLPGKAAFLFGALGISMFPEISLISYLFKLMSAMNLVNTYMALILPYIAWTMPLSLWILVSYFSQVPRDLDRAAQIDGASRLQILFKIILPLAAPGVYATGLLAFIFAFNEFLFALMLTIDQGARTIPVGIALFEGFHGQIPWGQIMAGASVASLPVVALTLVFQRRIVQGLTRGAVKG
ncbi:MAG: carbohydrate ABC transporter permease [Proteobacteria bacterium]|nr:carbohydrate ABC transporter permease [Pseudomonadota bacterium]